MNDVKQGKYYLSENNEILHVALMSDKNDIGLVKTTNGSSLVNFEKNEFNTKKELFEAGQIWKAKNNINLHKIYCCRCLDIKDYTCNYGHIPAGSLISTIQQDTHDKWFVNCVIIDGKYKHCLEDIVLSEEIIFENCELSEEVITPICPSCGKNMIHHKLGVLHCDDCKLACLINVEWIKYI